MQITEETIDNLARRSPFKTSQLTTILLVCSIAFTSLLVRQTLQIQHSCNPMIHWSGKLPIECQIATKNDFNDFNDFDNFSSAISPSVKRHKAIAQKSNIPKQQPLISQNTVEPQPDKITNNPQATEPKIMPTIPIEEYKAPSNSVGQLLPRNEITNNPQATEPKIMPTIPMEEDKDRSNSVGQFVSEHQDDIVGTIAGVAGGVGIVAAASATAVLSVPVAGAVLIGLGIWYAVRTVF